MTDPTVDADAFNTFEAARWERQVAGNGLELPVSVKLATGRKPA